ncbi:hypothetical protein F5884DRAFT_749435 [Xylogone sp. PMI_703]|nr:hypothetical protein F5884DRAFT_749435 [Xylogone sp. PMI_703]
MKSFLILLSGIAPTVFGIALDRRAGCNADNCARAVTGTAFGSAALSSHISQCSSYFSTTVIPPATTVWNPVATTYVFSTVNANLPPPSVLPGPSGTSTTIIPTNIPDFASAACDGNTTPVPVRYSSACSCAGVTHATSVAPSPTDTVDYTATVTVSSFVIIASGAPLPQPEFLQLAQFPVQLIDDTKTLGFVADITQAAAFVIGGTQLELLSNGYLSNEDNTGSDPLFFNSAASIALNGYAPVAVTIGQDLSLALRNEADGNDVIQDCGGFVSVDPSAGGRDSYTGFSCQEISLSVVPL